jgi:uracil-DNA glycosylase family 4
MTRSKPPACLSCAVCSHGSDFSAIEGTGSSGILICGEASGEHEQRDQLPFRPWAPAGGVIERIFRRMGVSRNQFAITNILRCRPRKDWFSGAPWEYSAARDCRPNLRAAIAEHKPRVIWALGNIAMRELTGFSGIAEEHESISYLSGYPVPIMSDLSDASIVVVPGFHPAYLRRGKMSHFEALARTLQRCVNIAAGRDREWMWGVIPDQKETHGTLEYQTHPSVSAADSFGARVLESQQAVVSYDIETYESASIDEDAREGFQDTSIRLVQFAVSGVGVMACPFERAYYLTIQRILHSPNVKCGHNVWLFDNKVLRAAGEREGLDLNPRGTIHDTLQMFHHLQPDLPAHLQFCGQFVQFPFPWKHLAGTDLAFYGCCDVDCTLRLYFMLEKTLKREGLWDDSPPILLQGSAAVGSGCVG